LLLTSFTSSNSHDKAPATLLSLPFLYSIKKS